MATLIAQYNSEGCVGRCDARCYNAKSKDCDCICTGKNHGAGAEKAIENTRELAEIWIEQARQDTPYLKDTFYTSVDTCAKCNGTGNVRDHWNNPWKCHECRGKGVVTKAHDAA